MAIPACIRLGSSDFFLHHGASVWVQSNDAIFGMRDRDCDVLIFGDSTAMTGINPDVVERNTGFKTCNIAVTNSVLAVTHNLTLNRYLANNAKPRVLLDSAFAGRLPAGEQYLEPDRLPGGLAGTAAPWQPR